jgi:hypothetical protein
MHIGLHYFTGYTLTILGIVINSQYFKHFLGALITWMAYKNYANAQQHFFIKFRREFFKIFTQRWCTDNKNMSAQSDLNGNKYSPNSIRIRGMVKNIPDFTALYGCAPNDEYYSHNDRCNFLAYTTRGNGKSVII